MRLPGIVVPGVDSDDWYTPPYIFEALGLTFDLDPASPTGGLPWVPAINHYSEADNGLTAPWNGRVWLNPPYSKPGPWAERLAAHGDGIGLFPADTSTAWFHEYITGATVVCFLRHRVTFVREGNDNVTSARFPSAMAAFGDECARAVQQSGLGWCVTEFSLSVRTTGGDRGVAPQGVPLPPGLQGSPHTQTRETNR